MHLLHDWNIMRPPSTNGVIPCVCGNGTSASKLYLYHAMTVNLQAAQREQQLPSDDAQKVAELEAAHAAAQNALMAELDALRRHKAMSEEQQRRLDAQV